MACASPRARSTLSEDSCFVGILGGMGPLAGATFADAIVLGCTELPLALPHALRDMQGIAFSDSIDALARSVIERYQNAKYP